MKKICKKCKEEKEISEFYKDKYSKDGYTTRCKYCKDHKYEMVCEYCGKDFLGTHKKQSFCSYECRGNSNLKQVEFNCDYCGKKSSVAECFYYREGQKNHYCSDECRHKNHGKLYNGENAPNWNGGDVFYNCDVCGTQSSQTPSIYNKSQYHYCSTKCMGKHREEIYKGENSPTWKGGDIFYNCDYCGKEHSSAPSQYNKTSRHYCSNICTMKHMGEINCGENHWNWNPDLTDEERKENESRSSSTEYRTFVRNVLKRDGFTCQYCGSYSKDLNAHHLNGYHWDVENRLNEDNAKTLCETCHSSFHKSYGSKYNSKEQYEEWIKNKNKESERVS